MKCFPYPLRYDTLEAFCHPSPSHLYAAPALLAGDGCATNGFVAIRASRGLWAADDFPETPAGFAESFSKIPLNLFPTSSPWHLLDDFRGKLFARAAITPFAATHRPSPSPAVRVGRVAVLLSMLQLVARLPRCEFSVADTVAPAMFFRATGALGCIAEVRGDLVPAIHIDPVRRHYDGCPATRSTMGKLPLPGWPPSPPID